MKSIRKPLVYVDAHSESPQTALDLAISHAKRFGVPLRIVDTIDDSTWARAFGGGLFEQLQQAILEDKDTALRAAVARAEAAGVEASFDLLYGSAAFAIIREVIDRGHDVVYKTMLGDPEARGRLLGNTARRLLRKCPNSVCLVHPRLRKVSRVVAAIGPETESGEGREMNDEILSTTQMLSEGGGEAHGIQSWELYGAAMLRGHMSTDELMAQAKAHYAKAYDNLAAICARGAVPQSNVHLIEGGTEQVVAQFANKPETDMLVLGSYARAGLRGMLLGNTAEMLLDNLESSVWTLKLSDYVSPLAQ